MPERPDLAALREAHVPTSGRYARYCAGCNQRDGYHPCEVLALADYAEALERTLALAMLPLEVLHMTEMDGRALCDSLKDSIREAVMVGREAILQAGSARMAQKETNDA